MLKSHLVARYRYKIYIDLSVLGIARTFPQVSRPIVVQQQDVGIRLPRRCFIHVGERGDYAQ